jgi:Holliday junction resolvasome RuvABC endonuclease subunit
VILALDLATNTGVCFGAGDVLPQLRSHRLRSTGDDIGAFLVEFQDWLGVLIEDVEPTCVVYESPVLPSTAKLVTLRKLYSLAGVTEMVCTREGLDCREVASSSAKLALTGSGRAEKHDMVRFARHHGLEPKTYIKDGLDASDEADAFGVWIAAVRIRKPEFAPLWDLHGPLFIGRAA